MMYHVILFSAFVVLQITYNDAELYDVWKVQRKSPYRDLWYLCSASNDKPLTIPFWSGWDGWNFCFELSDKMEVMFLCKKTGERKARLKAKFGNMNLGLYEIDAVDKDKVVNENAIDNEWAIARDKDGNQLKESVCKSISYSENYKSFRMTIRIYNGGVIWCDVYDKYFGYHHRFDKCDVVDEEEKWFDADEYATTYFFETYQANFKECPNPHPSHELCSKHGVAFKAIYVCKYGVHLAFKIRMSYGDVYLEDFMVLSTTISKYKDDKMKLSCRLFNVKVEGNGEKIYVQFYFASSWNCMEFTRKGDRFERRDYGNVQQGRLEFGICHKFNEYSLPEK